MLASSMCIVYKPNNKSTKMRLVINSSLKCPRTELSLNECMCKGPNVLSDLCELLMRFRTYLHVLISEVIKAYHALRTGLLEPHLRRVVWRRGDKMKDWNIYGFQVVVFGNCQAAVLLPVLIRMNCEIYKNIDIRADEKIQNNLSVDDLVTGGELEQVDMFMGIKNYENFKCSGRMNQIMKKGGLHIKAMQRTSSCLT